MSSPYFKKVTVDLCHKGFFRFLCWEEVKFVVLQRLITMDDRQIAHQLSSPFQLQIISSVCERLLRDTWATIAASTLPAVHKPTLLFVTESSDTMMETSQKCNKAQLKIWHKTDKFEIQLWNWGSKLHNCMIQKRIIVTWRLEWEPIIERILFLDSKHT